MRRSRRRREQGQVSLLIIGFALVLLMVTAVVVDASAAYLQRQGLSTIADGAALQGADLGSVGGFTDGDAGDRLTQTRAAVDEAVGDYLRAVGAYEKYPGLRHEVHVDRLAREVSVTVRAPLDLPLAIPGGPGETTVAATGRAAVVVLE